MINYWVNFYTYISVFCCVPRSGTWGLRGIWDPFEGSPLTPLGRGHYSRNETLDKGVLDCLIYLLLDVQHLTLTPPVVRV